MKRAEPSSLRAHRQTPHSSYDNFSAMNALRQTLVTEQRGLCCYCMGRICIGPTTMKVEHWKPRSKYPAEELNYMNLLGCCLGGEGNPRHLQHCDTRKGERDLKWNPADPSHQIEARIRYELDGKIKSDNVEFDAQLNEVVNLNLPILCANRKSVLDAILQWWKTEKKRIGGPVSRTRLEKEREKRTESQGHLTPYCQVAVWWIQQRLSVMST